MTGPRVALVVPMHNEAENVVPLLDELTGALAPLWPFEVLLVDDGSTDATRARARDWKARHGAAWLRILPLRARSGQSAATCAGFDAARAPIVATIDGDRQNDPRDLVAMVARIEAGELDGVTGRRAERRDPFVRRLSSRIGNAVRNAITRDRVADAATGIKAFRRDLVLAVPRFAGMHRFLATLVRSAGGRVAEQPVAHRPRVAGRAKYGIGNRAWRGLHDCFGVRWLRARWCRYEREEEC